MKQELQATCPFCSLHCADLRLTIDGGRLARFNPPCRLGRQRYAAALSCLAAGGEKVQPKKSMQRACTMLQASRRLLVVLSADVPNEAVESALNLAHKYSAVLTVEDEGTNLLSLGMKTSGYLTGTLGELHNLPAALLCGVEPARTHPRLGEVIGKELMGHALPLHPADAFEAIRWLRLGIADPDQLVPENLKPILQVTRTTSRGVIFFGPQWLQTGQPLATGLLLWLRDLNRTGRWYAHYLSPGANSIGVTEALLSFSGHASGMRFGEPSPVPSLRRWQATRLIEAGWPDLCLLVGQPYSFPEQTMVRLRKIKTILLDPQPPGWKPALWLPVAQAGVDSPGSMLRLDGLPLRLEPIVESTRTSVQALLAELAQELPS